MTHSLGYLIRQLLLPSKFLTGSWKVIGQDLDSIKIILIYDVDEQNADVWIDGIKHKRQNIYWKRI